MGGAVLRTGTLARTSFCLVIVLAMTTGFWVEGSENAEQEGWMCPPCGHRDVDKVYSEAGRCPICGMELISVEERRRMDDKRVQAAILIFDGVQIIDYTGPYEVFGQARFDVFTVSESGETITTSMGMSVNPSYSFETSPAPDVLLVPGGDVMAMLEDREVLDWVRTTAAEADYVLSVCNGAFILAEAGLLDGLTATTFHGLLDDFENAYQEVHVVRDQRFTDNGKIITSAGLSSGIDASIHLVSRIRGSDAAKSLALHLEYDWNEGEGFVRGALADRHLPSLDLDVPEGTEFRQLTSLGDVDHWRMRLAVQTSLSPQELMNIYRSALEEVPSWKQQAEPGNASEIRCVWAVDTEDDGKWKATASITEDEEQERVLVDLILERADA
ncbi:MAG: DJ-1/PfpI family protein [Acidobacteriota bacterium]